MAEPQPVELNTPNIQEFQPVEQTVSESEPQANVCYYYLIGLKTTSYIYIFVSRLNQRSIRMKLVLTYLSKRTQQNGASII